MVSDPTELIPNDHRDLPDPLAWNAARARKALFAVRAAFCRRSGGIPIRDMGVYWNYLAPLHR